MPKDYEKIAKEQAAFAKQKMAEEQAEAKIAMQETLSQTQIEAVLAEEQVG